MRKVRINAGTVGLVYKRNAYKGVLTEGTYWLMPGEKVEMNDMAKPFIPKTELSILLKDEKLAGLLAIIQVCDNEMALQYEDGIFSGCKKTMHFESLSQEGFKDKAFEVLKIKKFTFVNGCFQNKNNAVFGVFLQRLFKNVLTPGRYAFWKGVKEFSFTISDISKKEISEDINLYLLQRREVLPYIRAYVVEPYEKGVLFTDGKFERFLDPGVYYFWKNAIPLSIVKADLRQQQMEVSGQEILTKDKAALRVNFYTRYRVVDVRKALLDCKDYEKQLYILMQLALREYVGMYSLDELLSNKESISDRILGSVRESAGKIGVEITDCGIRDIILPGEIKEIMNQVLIAEKKAQANIITRREETASTRSLLNTAKLMEDNAMLFKLKEMEYVEKIADKINNISLSGGNQVVGQLREIFSV